MIKELHFGDNLDVLRRMPAGNIDLIYLDPPFNSNAAYNILYGTKRGGPSQAQAHTFGDTWTWGPIARRAIEETAQRHLKAGSLLDSFTSVFPESNMLAYLSMMAVRLIEMHRVLKETGSIYLHCDPTASHYLKILMDAIFGPPRFLNELVGNVRARIAAPNDMVPYMIRFYFIRNRIAIRGIKFVRITINRTLTLFTPTKIRTGNAGGVLI